jgi:hypothetical protein
MKKAFLISLFSVLALASNAQNDDASYYADTVKVGAYVISVHDINFTIRSTRCGFWLWFVYDNPDFDFSKQLDIPNAKSIEPPEIIMDSIDGKRGRS